MKGANILVATDLSDNSGVAARWAHQLAQTFDMNVVVTHVVAISVSNWASGAYDILEDPANFRLAEKRVEEWYEDHTGVHPDGVDVRVGTPLTQINESVDEYDAAMVVASMSGKGSVKKLFVGSTAQALASHPPCPVVIVHHEFATFNEPPRLTVGCDFSDNSDRAIEYAAKLAEISGASLDIVHADTAPDLDFIDEENIEGAPCDEDHQAWADEEMQDLEERLSDALAPIEYRTHIVHDAPSRGLISFARDHDQDIILVGRSGQSEFVGAVLGSVINTLLQSMPCTTVVVPLEDGD
jgi:nucleotide-binding universal stress UspA family protein